jgi:hypothetical protein
MTNQSLNDNYGRKEFGIQKFEIGVSKASFKLVDVFANSLDVWA